MSSDSEALWGCIETWKASADNVKSLLRDLDPSEWSLPTALPGWTVHDIAAHLAHLEAELAGIKQPEVEVPPAPHITGPMNEFTERGPIVRRDWAPEEIVSEFGQAVAIRYEKLLSDPPEDGDALAPGFAGLIGWSWKTLLTNRPVDLWMHEQDVRRATGRPGGLASAGAVHTTRVFADSLPYVVGKRAQAPIGASVVLHLTGAPSQTFAVVIGEDGRGRLVDAVPAEPTVRITLAFADWIALAGGRLRADEVESAIEGERELGERALNAMSVTP